MTDSALVIGAGLAGLTAGLRLAQGGWRVRLLAKGVGGTHLGGGTIDVLGYAPQLVEHPWQALPAFLAAQPQHPYARAGLPALSAAAEWFLSTTASLGLAYTGSIKENYLLPTAVGAAKPAALVPASMAAGELRAGGKFLFVGFSNLRDFYPTLLADNLARARLPGRPAIHTRALVVDAPGLLNEADMPATDFARAFDKPDFRAALAQGLRPKLQPGERIGFPALLGLDRPAEAWQDLQAQLGAPVFEIPTLPPSIPGMRLFEKLKEALAAAGARIQIGFPVIEARLDGSRCLEVVTAGAARSYRWPAQHFVLASGGIASGGILTEADGAVRESIFNLPLAGLPAPATARFRPGYFEPQPLSQIGVEVDSDLRPVNGAGQVVIENLRAAGATLAHAEPWREKSGDGISLVTGYRAAQALLEAKRDRG